MWILHESIALTTREESLLTLLRGPLLEELLNSRRRNESDASVKADAFNATILVTWWALLAPRRLPLVLILQKIGWEEVTPLPSIPVHETGRPPENTTNIFPRKIVTFCLPLSAIGNYHREPYWPWLSLWMWPDTRRSYWTWKWFYTWPDVCSLQEEEVSTRDDSKCDQWNPCYCPDW